MCVKFVYVKLLYVKLLYVKFVCGKLLNLIVWAAAGGRRRRRRRSPGYRIKNKNPRQRCGKYIYIYKLKAGGSPELPGTLSLEPIL